MIRLSTVLLASFLIAAPVKADTAWDVIYGISEEKCNNDAFCMGLTIGEWVGIGKEKCEYHIYELVIINRLNVDHIIECSDIINNFSKTTLKPPYDDLKSEILSSRLFAIKWALKRHILGVIKEASAEYLKKQVP